MDQITIPGVKELQKFLNKSAPSSVAHGSIGISAETFLFPLVFAAVYCALQIMLFSTLRRRYRHFFQPLCYLIPQKYRVKSPDESFFGWFKFGFKISLDVNDYIPSQSQGMDTVLLIRFINRLIVLFVALSIVNIPLLIPLHFWGGKSSSESSNRGLDLLTTSHISNKNIEVYLVHFTICIFIVLFYYYILTSELGHVVNIKHNGITELYRQNRKRHKYLTFVLITNVPTRQRNQESIINVFNSVPGGVKEVWPIYDYRTLNSLVKEYKKYLRLMEKFELDLITKEVQGYKYQRDKLILPRNKSIGISHQARYVPTMYQPVDILNLFKLSIVGISKQVSTYDFYKEKIQYLRNKITEVRNDIIKNTPDQVTYESCFVRFNSIAGAHFARQILISNNPNNFTIGTTVHELNPRSIIWKNVITDSQKRQSLSRYLRTTLLGFISIFVILTWMLPVAFVGSLSQLPYLTALIPTISWINNLPGILKDFIGSILPTIMLTCLTGVAHSLFKWISSKRLEKLKSETEVKLANWIFLFLFFQLFIIISVSSGTIVILEHIISHPISVPSMVAEDFPKAANFFSSFFVLRGLTYLGNNLLQSGKFISFQFLINLMDKTPREKFERRKSLMTRPHWGIVYSTFSVYGSIGIVYSVISPLISIFCLLNFIMDLLALKYSFNYIYHYQNKSETFGKLYSIALRQLHAGIYSLQIYLIGIFFLVKDENGEKKCLLIGFLMIVVLIMTVNAHIKLNKKNEKLLDYIPLNKYSHLINGATKTETEAERLILRNEYLHPCFSFNPEEQTIWIPKDQFGISESEKAFLESDLGVQVYNESSDISDEGVVTVTGAPSDEKW